jgi:hypothetical protein
VVGGTNNMGDLGMDGRIILKLVLEKLLNLADQRMILMATFCEHDVKPSGHIKTENFLNS